MLICNNLSKLVKSNRTQVTRMINNIELSNKLKHGNRYFMIIRAKRSKFGHKKFLIDIKQPLKPITSLKIFIRAPNSESYFSVLPDFLVPF